RKFVVQIQAGYTEPLNLWATPALPSGNRKTQVLKTITNPLRQWESEQLTKLGPSVAEAQSKLETAIARISHLRKKAAHAEVGSADYADVQQKIQDMETNLPAIPRLPKLWAEDVTPEKLGSLMVQNGEAMSLISDEGGIFDILAGRYSNGVPN